MKIIAIRGKNIASLEGEFGIDFTTEPLLSTGIFAISGPTGAGKSTLLDTMCLALFARTPRTSLAKENKIYVRDVNDEVLVQGDPRFLLRRGTASGYAEVDFLGLTGYHYRARWSVGRARDKENGRLQNYRITLHNLDKEQEEQGSRSDIQNRIIELIGLTFDQFTRSVLLAQNDFSTFLKAEQGEKASLLEKLTGTEHYSRISKLVFDKTGEAKNAYEQISGRIQGIELLTEEEEKEFQEKLKSTELQIEKLNQLRISKQELTERVQASAKLIETKKEQQKDTALLLEKLLTHLLDTNKQIEKGKEELVKAEDTAKKLQPEIRQALQLDVEIRAYMPVVEEAKKQWQKAEESCSGIRKQLQDTEQKQKKAEEQLALLKGWFQKYADKEKVANQFEALLIHLDEAFLVKKEIQQTEDKINSLLAGQKELNKQLEITVSTVKEKETLRELTEKNLQKEQELLQALSRETIENDLHTSRHQREKLLVEQARFVTTGDIVTLRDKLIEGEPCPVCGSHEHPYALPAVHQEAEERTKQIAALTLRLSELENTLQQYQKRQSQIAQLQQQLVHQEKELSGWRSRLSELGNQEKVLLGQVESERQLQGEQQKRLGRSLQSTSALFGNDEWQEKWLADPEGFRSTLVTFTDGWNRKKEQLKGTEKQLDVLRSELLFKKEQVQKEEKEITVLLKNYQDKQVVADRLVADRGRLLGGKPAHEVEEELTRVIESHRKQNDALLITVREQATQVDQTKGMAGQIVRELEQAEKEWKDHSDKLQAWIEANNVSPEGLTIEQESEQLNKQKAEYTFRLRTHTENQKRVDAFRKELNECREKYEQWAKLNELVGSADGGKFRRIAQGYTLDVLINYANVQLKNLTHRYRLERVPDTLALQVIDRDMCDEVRTVHSLSGGESFLVSLALALGLSSLSSNRMKVESLFIDEGFGSLDSDTLRVAMDALESLRTQGRKIGVISHVQEMTERIPVQIRVCRSGNGRSYLEVNPLTP